jgi:hypothetical protein
MSHPRSRHDPSCLRSRSRLPGAVVAAAFGASVIGFQHTAVAGDNKIYPGSMCESFDGSSDVKKTGVSAIINSNYTFNRTVYCPVVRDNTTNTDGTGDIWVYVYRSSYGTGALTCTFYSTSATDGAIVNYYSKSTSAVGAIKLTIPVPNSTAGGPYDIVCVLPARSEVYTYQVLEHL